MEVATDLQTGMTLSQIWQLCINGMASALPAQFHQKNHRELPADLPWPPPNPAWHPFDVCPPAPSQDGANAWKPHRHTARPPFSTASTGFPAGWEVSPAGRAGKLPLRGGRRQSISSGSTEITVFSRSARRAEGRRRQLGPRWGKGPTAPASGDLPTRCFYGFVCPFFRRRRPSGRWLQRVRPPKARLGLPGQEGGALGLGGREGESCRRGPRKGPRPGVPGPAAPPAGRPARHRQPQGLGAAQAAATTLCLLAGGEKNAAFLGKKKRGVCV